MVLETTSGVIMGQGKIALTVGSLSFSAEGDEEWLSKQLLKFVEAVPTLRKAAGERAEQGDGGGDDTGAGDAAATGAAGTLLSRIKAYKAETNHTKRFLATAYWLKSRGENDLSTAKVTKALSDAHQRKLSNPAQCLNSNVSKGYCEKQGSGFYITAEGLTALGAQ
jgi:hypothetical protein